MSTTKSTFQLGKEAESLQENQLSKQEEVLIEVQD